MTNQTTSSTVLVESSDEARMLQGIDDFYWKAFFMLKANGIDGDYLEFGCGSNIRSFRAALRYRRSCRTMKLFAFDSFEGLPEPRGIDTHPFWSKGSMAVTVDQFHGVLANAGSSREEYSVVPGFFDQTLIGKVPQDYQISKAAFIMIDCDLYESTVPVLDFCRPILQEGTIVAFDDWFCFRGNPARGEQRALSEFRERYPSILWHDFLPFGWHGRSFLTFPE